MPDTIEAQNALVARLMAMPGRPAIAYPNGPLVDGTPRIVVAVTAPSQRTMGVSGITEADVEIVARVEVDADGKFDGAATAIVRDMIAHFRVGLRTGGVQIIQAPSPRSRYTVGGIYHIPVVIRARTYF